MSYPSAGFCGGTPVRVTVHRRTPVRVTVHRRTPVRVTVQRRTPVRVTVQRRTPVWSLCAMPQARSLCA
eukprot:362156-Chlamydomonas_euryale.AAC.28